MFTLVSDDISSGLKVILFSIFISEFLLDNATITIAVIENKLKNNSKYPSDINCITSSSYADIINHNPPTNKEEVPIQFFLLHFKL